MADYKTIRGTATFEYEEKRSRFIATASFADTEEKALAVLNAVRAANRTARHNVYAYVLQNGRTRYSDDGEPSGTAGMPRTARLSGAGGVNAAASWPPRISASVMPIRASVQATVRNGRMLLFLFILLLSALGVGSGDAPLDNGAALFIILL